MFVGERVNPNFFFFLEVPRIPVRDSLTSGYFRSELCTDVAVKEIDCQAVFLLFLN